jgi:hypothetical protein
MDVRFELKRVNKMMNESFALLCLVVFLLSLKVDG